MPVSLRGTKKADSAVRLFEKLCHIPRLIGLLEASGWLFHGCEIFVAAALKAAAFTVAATKFALGLEGALRALTAFAPGTIAAALTAVIIAAVALVAAVAAIVAAIVVAAVVASAALTAVVIAAVAAVTSASATVASAVAATVATTSAAALAAAVGCV